MGIVNSVFLGVGLILLTGPLAAAGDAGSFASREAATDYARGLRLGLMLSGEGKPAAEDLFLQGLRDGLARSYERLDRDAATALVEEWLRSRFGDFRLKSSYAMGWGSGKQLEQTKIPIDGMLLSLGVWDGISGGPAPLTPNEVTRTVKTFRNAERKHEKLAFTKVMVDNQQAGKAFLARNAERPGVTVLPSGLQYEVLQEGAGTPPPTDGKVDLVVLARKIDDSVFFDSREAGAPLTVELSSAIKGWREAVVLMKPGAKWRLFVPPSLAYAEFGWAERVGPGETLVFDLQLLAVH